MPEQPIQPSGWSARCFPLSFRVVEGAPSRRGRMNNSQDSSRPVKAPAARPPTTSAPSGSLRLMTRSSSSTASGLRLPITSPTTAAARVNNQKPAKHAGLSVALVGLVHAFAQGFSRLEMRNVLARQSHGFTGAWIATHARGTVAQRETAKAANLDTLTLGQRTAHLLKDTAYCQLNIGMTQMLLLSSQIVNQFGLCHFPLRVVEC